MKFGETVTLYHRFFHSIQYFLSVPQLVTSSLAVFWQNFLQWYSSLTPGTFLLIYWPLLFIDIIRVISKTVFLPIHVLWSRQRGQWKPPEEFNPKITIIIPAHNEEAIIVRAIETVLETNYANKEVLVIDDGSKDKTYSLAYPYHQKGLIKLIRRETASGSKAGALNYGVLYASGEIVVSVDADTMIERNSVREAVKTMANPKVSAVSGNVRIFSGDHGAKNILVKLQQYEYFINLELGRRFSSMMGTLLIISGAFGVFWKDLVRSLGNYDTDTITEDFDITFKMRKLGRRIVFNEKAIAWTFVPETWKEWLRQRRRWTRGQAETLWKHRNLFSRSGFNLVSVLAVYDMLLIDIVVLFIRTAWLLVLVFRYAGTLAYVSLLMFIMYTVAEVYTYLVAWLISPRKEPFRRVLLAPLMVLVYRPIYSLVRVQAYIGWLSGREINW